jgi:hypothetical protein
MKMGQLFETMKHRDMIPHGKVILQATFLSEAHLAEKVLRILNGLIRLRDVSDLRMRRQGSAHLLDKLLH